MKQVPPQGDTIHGYFVPGGTRIAQSFVGIERSKDMFGDDADIFRPERWLNITPDKRREMTQTVELVFGHGRWGCAGKPVAMMEMNKIYVEVRFSFISSACRSSSQKSSVTAAFQLPISQSTSTHSYEELQHGLSKGYVGSSDGKAYRPRRTLGDDDKRFDTPRVFRSCVASKRGYI